MRAGGYCRCFWLAELNRNSDASLASQVQRMRRTANRRAPGLEAIPRRREWAAISHCGFLELRAFTPCSAATPAPEFVISAVQRVVGGEPQTLPMFFPTNAFTSGPLYPGPPRHPQPEQANAEIAAINMTAKTSGSFSLFSAMVLCRTMITHRRSQIEHQKFA
jgi:hypothetical protein